MERYKRVIIGVAFEKCGGNQMETARMPGIGRDGLRYKLLKYGLI
jgi:DNA-binding protein Fis